MKKNKFNPDLLKEELNRFKLLNEYDFYQEKKEMPEYKDLIQGDLDEADDAEIPDDLEPADDAVDNAANDIAGDLGVDTDGGNEETSGDIPEEEPTPEEPVEAEPEAEPATDETEVDVTSLVKGSEEAKHAADVASHNSELLLNKLASLEAQISSMAQITAKIDGLEQEIIKRNPTQVEKLEMRSLSSYPYSQKLTDYWADKEGQYNVMNTEKKPQEYVLKQDDVDADYSESNIKKSFNVTDDYEEEDI